MKFKTYSGSVYELDEPNKQIRRLTGAADPTPRQGPDGQYKKYLDLMYPPTKDKSLVIIWERVEDADGRLVLRTTQTSLIVEFL